MTIQRMDNVGVVVDDLAAAIAFFVDLGLELEGETTVEGPWADRVVGLDGVRVDVAMVRTPDGHSRVELMKFHTPTAVSAEPNVRRTRPASAASCSPSTTSATSFRAYASTAPNWLVSGRSSRTATGSATSAAPKA